MPETISKYADTLNLLEKNPDDRFLQHQAVLTLARAGATDFALEEYQRYGLDKVSDLEDGVLFEDIMSLGGRLYKDLALVGSGETRRGLGASSSQKYNDAFKKTGGFYSGINAATMALVAGFPAEMIKDRANAILRELPDIKNLTPEQLYYVEATRAEAHLLLGERTQASTHLRRAIAHDPINYPAHGTTLKQFEMIIEASKSAIDWAKGIRPPQSVHFSGHMFGLDTDEIPDLPALSKAQIDKLKVDISDTIQRQDIGYGYGALAAGSDILIAEALLTEGCELHVILPVSQVLFIEHSVAPYGARWVKKFKKIIKLARSVNIVSSDVPWPLATAVDFASTIAMGNAVRTKHALFSGTGQLLIWDGGSGVAGTSADARMWQTTGRPQFHIAYPGTRGPQNIPVRHVEMLEQISLADETKVHAFKDISMACAKALEQRAENPTLKQGLHISLDHRRDHAAGIAKTLAGHAVPGGILVSDNVANLLALRHPNQYATDALGSLPNGRQVYALRRKGGA